MRKSWHFIFVQLFVGNYFNFYYTLDPDLWELSGGKGHSFDHSLKKEEANLSLVCKCYSDVIEHCN